MDLQVEKRRQYLEIHQPNLRGVSWDITSAQTMEYNCIAFALGIENQRWQPEPKSGDHWPDGIPQTDTIDAWFAVFEKFGFERCNDPNFEIGFNKIAIYVDDEGPYHVAKLISSGKWHSKLGHLEDIVHPLDCLGDGKPKYFLRKSIHNKQPSKIARQRAKRQ